MEYDYVKYIDRLYSYSLCIERKYRILCELYYNDPIREKYLLTHDILENPCIYDKLYHEIANKKPELMDNNFLATDSMCVDIHVMFAPKIYSKNKKIYIIRFHHVEIL